MFSSLVLSQWIPDSLEDSPETGVAVSVDPTLPTNRALSLLNVDDGSAVLSLSPEWAAELAFADGECVEEEEVAARLKGAGVSFHDSDHLFYLTRHEQAVLRGEIPAAEVRRLTSADAALFQAFTGEAPEDDLDEAFVELDHWLVFGTVVDERLACAASMYPWTATTLADLGVITLPEFRGRGLGRTTVRAISAEALRLGYEPQYRCQLDNTASFALAQASGYTHFGRWQVIDTGE